MVQEQIMQIKNWEEYYEISNYGYVNSLDRVFICGRYMKQSMLSKGRRLKIFYTNGYSYVALIKSPKKTYCLLSRLVATHFIPNPENKKEVNHIDGDKKNNAVWNLEWVTPKENVAHAFRTGLNDKSKKRFELSKKPILQYDRDGNFIAEWDSLTAASHISELSCICKNLKGLTKHSGGFIWKYKNGTQDG